jgi:hypothetical protein
MDLGKSSILQNPPYEDRIRGAIPQQYARVGNGEGTLMQRWQDARARWMALWYWADPVALEMTGAGVGVLWGALLLVANPTFFLSAPTYHALAALAPEWVWGAVFLSASALQGGTLLWGVILPAPPLVIRNWLARRRAVALLGLLWGYIACAFILTFLFVPSAQAPATALYLSVALWHFWVWRRVGKLGQAWTQTQPPRSS